MIKKKLMVKRILNTPEVYYKKGAIACLKSIEATNLLLMVARPVHESEYFAKVEKYTKEKTTLIESIDIINQDQIIQLREKYTSTKLDAIVAIGGGSTLDPAKILRILLSHPELSFEDLKTNQFITDNHIKLVAIPTTPGTGSETTSVAVIYDAHGHKFPFTNQGFMPDMAILDHAFLTTLPLDLLHVFGADIFSHAAEGALSMMSTPIMKSISSSSLDLLQLGFAQLHENPTDVKALGNIMYAGYLAGIVQGNAYVGVGHALAHSLEQQIKISHGAAILWVFKNVLGWYQKQTDKPIYQEYLESWSSLGFEDYSSTIDPQAIDIDQWATATMQDPSISTSPIRFKQEQVIELIQWILQHK
ncbi:iron-containing alcohol dehydrogenase [Candidatus Lokiarchaeum ossiferum]|uniref:iron-containing alcohol dehydrogenase n=1 Tax=Candidatus Lokiarchaeum ossiferum TaxID=2951803 RepID=UPI00352F0599